MPVERFLARLQQIVDEHRDLQKRFDAETAWWQEVQQMGKPLFGEMASRLKVLRQHLEDHFHHEAEFAELAERDLAAGASPMQTSCLVRDHANFLQQFDELAERANQCEENHVCWGQVGQEFSRLVQTVEEHEKAELKLFAACLENQKLIAACSS